MLSLIVLSLAIWHWSGGPTGYGCHPSQTNRQKNLLFPLPAILTPASGPPNQGIFPNVVFNNSVRFHRNLGCERCAWLAGVLFPAPETAPDGHHGTGLSTWDFSNVGSVGNGYLPTGTIVYFGDLDGFSGTRHSL